MSAAPRNQRLVAWVGGMFFMHHMPAHGLHPVHIPLTGPRALGWDDLVAAVGQEPDAVVYCDRSLPPPLLGVERYPCPTAFYCIDSHIHSWYPAYAAAFDACAVSLRDHLPLFEAALPPGRALWLPPFAEDRYRPCEADKEFDLLFAGTVNPQTTPQRCDFLSRLGGVMPGLAVRRGDFAELFPRARVALNIAERGDLNFRVFEALACGACLLTPRIENGQSELFEDGVHFITYRPDDERDAAAKAMSLLADDERRRTLARAGAARVNALHRPEHRAQAMAGLLERAFAENAPARRLAAPDPALRQRLRLLWLHWAENCGDAELAALHLAEARRQT